jgi:hypothetical protein
MPKPRPSLLPHFVSGLELRLEIKMRAKRKGLPRGLNLLKFLGGRGATRTPDLFFSTKHSYFLPRLLSSISALWLSLGYPFEKRGVGLISQPLVFSGSPGRTRTADQVVNSHPLYLLSYRGVSRSRRISLQTAALFLLQPVYYSVFLLLSITWGRILNAASRIFLRKGRLRFRRRYWRPSPPGGVRPLLMGFWF